MKTNRLFWLLSLGLLVWPLGCRWGREPTRDQSPSARPEIVETLREDLALERHPSDGGGRAWLEGGSGDPATAVTAGHTGRWSVVYETGPLGIAEGGWIFFQAPPFWHWSMPQGFDPEQLGFTLVTTEAEGVELAPATIDQQLLAIEVRGRALEPGEQVRIVYGAGPTGALADRYAEHRSRFWVAVDGNGDGIRGPVADQLWVDVLGGPPARLVLTLPSTALPGETVDLTIAVLDRFGNLSRDFTGEIALSGPASDLGLPSKVGFAAEDEGTRGVEITFVEEGIYRIEAVGADGLAAASNPLMVAGGVDRILWGDLHGHSNLSDGTGTPEDYFRYARDVAALDVVSLTDHDHWGMEPLALHPEIWEQITTEVELFNQPEELVTLLGYEWTNGIHGHRHVLFFQDHGELFDSIDPEFDTPDELWAALRGQQALTVAHHSAGGPIATNWKYLPDPELEPVTEIVSVHGSSEAMDSPAVIYSPVPGNFVRDVLDSGVRFGFIGSGDSHDGHPGLAHLNGPSGGLAAILSQGLTREDILTAIRRRRVYATNGPRIILRVSLGELGMGSVLEAGPHAPDRLKVFVAAPEPLERLDLIRSGAVAVTVPGDGQRTFSWQHQLEDLRPGEYVYVRAIQVDGGAAWSSPIFLE
ncbi:MAG: CehA/McbA family metallohydrolase [Thermoanaerobaculia bacterium]